MSKKIVYLIQGIIVFIYACLITFFMIYFKMNQTAYYSVLFSTMGLGLINAIYTLVLVVNDITSKRLTGAIHASTVFIPTAFYYAVRYFKNYMKYRVLYFSLFFGILAITILVLAIINPKLSPQKPVMTRKKG